VRLVAIGASTGGPQALLTLLSQLPPDLNQAVLVVQHMAEGFIPGSPPGWTAWCRCRCSSARAVAGSRRHDHHRAQRRQPARAGRRLRVMCTPPLPGQFHVPGIDATFESVAQALGPDALGVL
jgi:two-component system chemotaxis response regulator CheB